MSLLSFIQKKEKYESYLLFIIVKESNFSVHLLNAWLLRVNKRANALLKLQEFSC